jgi:DNA topoisomerase III
LLKSAELTGQWERKLRQIEAGNYEIVTFMTELKEMVTEIVGQVKQSPKKVIAIAPDEKPAHKIQETPEIQVKASKPIKENDNTVCPKCKNGNVIKGKQSWGCSAYREGCDFRLPFEFLGKKLSDKVIRDLCIKLKTGEIKGFDLDGKIVNGSIHLKSDFQPELKEKPSVETLHAMSLQLQCPRCKEGLILKGKSSWGCSNFRNGCQLRVPFSFMGKALSDHQMEQLILKGKTGKITGFIGIDGSKIDGTLQFDTEFGLVIK